MAGSEEDDGQRTEMAVKSLIYVELKWDIQIQQQVIYSTDYLISREN